MNILLRLMTVLVLFGTWGLAVSAEEKSVVEIGNRRELFVDDWLIDQMQGVTLELHQPVPQEIAITYDAPNEGNISYYVRVFQDEGKYRMYYRGADYDWQKKKTTHQVVCYAESSDGVTWTKPNLGLYEFKGSKENNIVWNGEGNHNFSPFKDMNPDCKPEAKYKALGGGGKGLFAMSSPDGLHWKKMSDRPVITKGKFDSQNLAFWDSVRGRYVDFHRGFTQGVRDIMTCTSSDFLNWTEPEFINQVGAERQHLYTNATIAYQRAPHLFLAFPKRFVPERKAFYHPDPDNNHPGVSDGVFMTSRDGMNWHRWDEAFLRPGQNLHRWWQRNNHIAWGIVETQNDIPGEGRELSLYAIENYYVGPCRLRRYTIRLDGFVSVNAPYKGGEFTTRPFKFSGDQLEVNYATSAAGSLHVEIQDETGTPIPRFTLGDSEVRYGDELAGIMKWKSGDSLEALKGKTIKLRFVLKDADVYSIRFK